jgi:flagellar motor switch protein FliM
VSQRHSQTSQAQREIDQLIQGGLLRGASGMSEGRKSGSNEVRTYDFKRPNRVSSDRQRTMEAMYGQLVKSFEGWLGGRVREVVSLHLQSVSQISFGEYALSLPGSCNAFICNIGDASGEQPIGEQAVIDFGRDLAFFLVDRLFGGGAQQSVPDRALTPIERLAVRTVGERLMQLVSEIWRDHVKLDLTLAGFESIPEIIKAAPRESPVLVANIEAGFARTASIISICLPLSVLEAFFVTGTKGTATHLRPDNHPQRALAEATLRGTQVTVSARLPDFHLTMKDIAGVKVGSTLSTGIPVDAPIRMLIGGRPRFDTAPGRVGKRLAVRVLDRIGPPLTPESDIK